VGEWWQGGGTTLCKQLVRERFIPVTGEIEQQRVVGEVSLDDRLSLLLPPSGPPGYLQQQLAGGFDGAEIGAEESSINLNFKISSKDITFPSRTNFCPFSR